MAGTKKANVRRKTCGEKGCRKKAVEDTDFCALHQEEEDPMEVTKKLTEVERLRLFEIDNALRNHTQEIKILDQEQRLEQVEYDARKRTRQQRVNALQGAIQQRTLEQRAMLAEYGEKYKFNPKFASIDDRTGTIQDHTPEE